MATKNPEQLDRNIEKMKKRGLFGERQPFVHQGIRMLVLDESHLPFAYVCQEGDALLRDTRQAMTLLQKMTSSASTQSRANSARSRAVGSFMHDILDPSGEPWNYGLKNRARMLLRDLIDPSEIIQDQFNQINDALSVLTSLENYLERKDGRSY